MGDTPLVRVARPEEASKVAQLVASLLSELDGQPVDPSLIAASAESVLALPTVTAFLAFFREEPIGVLVLNECAAIYAGGAFGEISELYVNPEWRSSGVAKQLVLAAQTFAKERGWKRLEVGAPPQPEWARSLAFYRREGFEEVGPRLRCIL
ncbi:GNAT family N-acetyltransferase [Tropicibacter sp. R16_0]|uniref:GNAT family N-acetyltransferase n=1 Tax=Tropicibacter sp. R16_0 TaxID=2821102 RepID=UPI001ADC3DA3|nr:GNAT family N-acetyltransferase [Tropicibacter sp. R16_0]MBO9452618.1 GNAT family N-acetyltransferase [Tropicibacter sp. R16_0]